VLLVCVCERCCHSGHNDVSDRQPPPSHPSVLTKMREYPGYKNPTILHLPCCQTVKTNSWVTTKLMYFCKYSCFWLEYCMQQCSMWCFTFWLNKKRWIKFCSKQFGMVGVTPDHLGSLCFHPSFSICLCKQYCHSGHNVINLNHNPVWADWAERI